MAKIFAADYYVDSDLIEGENIKLFPIQIKHEYGDLLSKELGEDFPEKNVAIVQRVESPGEKGAGLSSLHSSGRLLVSRDQQTLRALSNCSIVSLAI